MNRRKRRKQRVSRPAVTVEISGGADGSARMVKVRRSAKFLPYQMLIGARADVIPMAVFRLTGRSWVHGLAAWAAVSQAVGQDGRAERSKRAAMVLRGFAMRSAGLHLVACVGSGLFRSGSFETSCLRGKAEQLAKLGQEMVELAGTGAHGGRIDFPVGSGTRSVILSLVRTAGSIRFRHCGAASHPVRHLALGWENPIASGRDLKDMPGTGVDPEGEDRPLAVGPISRLSQGMKLGQGDGQADSLDGDLDFMADRLGDGQSWPGDPEVLSMAAAAELLGLLNLMQVELSEMAGEIPPSLVTRPFPYQREVTAWSAVEAPRGVVTHRLTFDGDGRLTDTEVVMPSERDLVHLERAVGHLVDSAERSGVSRPEMEALIERLVLAHNPCADPSGKFVSVEWD
ncbi:MAG: hypothetical protein ABIJ46_03535 [bacterium]